MGHQKPEELLLHFPPADDAALPGDLSIFGAGAECEYVVPMAHKCDKKKDIQQVAKGLSQAGDAWAAMDIEKFTTRVGEAYAAWQARHAAIESRDGDGNDVVDGGSDGSQTH